MAEASAEEQQAETQHQANLNAAATTTAIVLGAALIAAGSVTAAEASRPIIVPSPPVENNYHLSRQPVVEPWQQPPPSANISPMENLRQTQPIMAAWIFRELYRQTNNLTCPPIMRDSRECPAHSPRTRRKTRNHREGICGDPQYIWRGGGGGA